MEITRAADTLRARIGDQPSYRVWPRGDDAFYYRVAPATIRFQRDAAGRVTSLKAFGITAPRIP
jgi:hypothetical protein